MLGSRHQFDLPPLALEGKPLNLKPFLSIAMPPRVWGTMYADAARVAISLTSSEGGKER
jgi:hypothetical protein